MPPKGHYDMFVSHYLMNLQSLAAVGVCPLVTAQCNTFGNAACQQKCLQTQELSSTNITKNAEMTILPITASSSKLKMHFMESNV